MGRYFLLLDPDGFDRCAEPGAHFEWAAPQHITDIRSGYRKATPNESPTPDYAFAVPSVPGKNGVGTHPWILPTPRQSLSTWTQDSRLDAHVLRDGGEWVWATGVTVRQWEPTKKPGETGFPKNLWQTVHIAEDAESLFDLDWTAIGLAAGVTFEATPVVVGAAGSPPSGGSMANLTPYIQCHMPPGPDDQIIFGFGEYAILFNVNGVTIIKGQGDGTFVRLGIWDYDTPDDNPFARKSPGVMSVPSFFQHVRTCMVLNVPPAHLSLFFGSGVAHTVETYRLEPGQVQAVNVSEGSWWVAGLPKKRLQFQVQVVGYENVDTGVLRVPNSYPDFDLGVSYRPQLEPSLNAYGIVHEDVGVTLPPATISTNSYSVTSSLGEELILTLLTGASPGTPWSSDGVNHAGFWRIEMVAATDRVGGYTAPALRNFALKFGVYLVPRINSPLLMDDSQFAAFSGEVSYYDPDSKRVTVILWDTGAKLLRDAGFDEREGYPLQIWEDTTGNDVPDTLRVTGWVRKTDLEEFLAETDDNGGPVTLYRLQAKGLLSRGESKWGILPQMVDPGGGGYIEHTYAVREAVLAMGIDVTNPAQWFEATDTWAGTVRSRLPGTWADRPYALQLNKDNGYAPSYDESKLEYALRIASEWAGWVLYERLDGKICYHPDLMFELALGGIDYYRSFRLWRTTAEAAANSESGQVYEAGAKQYLREVRANSIRIQGKEDLDFDPVVVNDDLGWTYGPYENFLGEPKPETLTLKMAVSAQAAEVLGQVALLTLGQRGVDWPVSVQMPPWEMVTADLAEVGFVVAVQGKGDRLVTHLQVELLLSDPTRSLLTSRFTTTRLPALAAAALTGFKPYPGRMNPAV